MVKIGQSPSGRYTIRSRARTANDRERLIGIRGRGVHPARRRGLRVRRDGHLHRRNGGRQRQGRRYRVLCMMVPFTPTR